MCALRNADERLCFGVVPSIRIVPVANGVDLAQRKTYLSRMAMQLGQTQCVSFSSITT